MASRTTDTARIRTPRPSRPAVAAVKCDADRPLNVLPFMDVTSRTNVLANSQRLESLIKELDSENERTSDLRQGGSDRVAISYTQHLFPAASPRLSARSTRRIPLAQNAETGSEKLQRLSAASREPGYFDASAWCDAGRHGAEAEPQLWISAKRWLMPLTRSQLRQGQQGATMVLVHASAMHKELWNAFVEDLVLSQERHGGVVEEVWALDTVATGTAALINQPYLGDVFHWSDNSRDILRFVSDYLPSEVNSRTLPVLLDPEDTVKAGGRRIFAVGHSSGGASLARAAFGQSHNLFDGIILVDPIIAHPHTDRGPLIDRFAKVASERQTTFSSFGAAHASFSKKGVFKSWDPRVLHDHIAHGFYTANRDEVTLRCTMEQEIANYMDAPDAHLAWNDIASDCNQSTKLHFVRSAQCTSIHPGGEEEQDLLFTLRSSTVDRANAGHFVPMENPQQLAFFVHRAVLNLAQQTTHTEKL